MNRYFILLAIILFAVCACKIQEAPGAYQAATGKPATEKVDKTKSEKAVTAQSEVLSEDGQKSTNVQNGGGVVPTVEDVVRKGLAANTELQDVVEVPQMEAEEPIVETVIEEPKVEVTEVKTDDVATRSEKIEIVEGDASAGKKMYHVVIGSFGKKENAQRLLKEWSDGHSPVLAVNEKGMFRVILSSHDEYEQAKAGANAVRNYIPDVWVLIKLQ